jgi:hypothetical protein
MSIWAACDGMETDGDALSHVIHSMHSLRELKLQLMILQFSCRETIKNELDVVR